MALAEKDKEKEIKIKMKNDIEQKIRIRREERAKKEELAEIRYKELLKKKPVHLKIEERFIREYETPALEEKKKAL